MPIWIALFVIAAVAAVVFAMQSSTRGRILAQTQADYDAARAEAEKARAAEKAARDELSARKAEMLETRDKLKDVKKKLHDEQSRENRLRGEEHELRAEAERAHLKLQDLLAALEHKDVELTRMRGEVEGHKKQRRSAPEPRPEPVKVERPAPAPMPPDVAELAEKLKKAEESFRSEKSRASELESEVKKHRGRAETNHRIYLVTKGELEVAKDKLVTIERRIRESEGGVRRRRPEGAPAAPAEAAPAAAAANEKAAEAPKADETQTGAV